VVACLCLGLALAAAAAVWLVASDSPLYRYALRLSTDREFIRHEIQRAGPLGPAVFVSLQALQVLIAPIPGEATGVLGGVLFGETLGFVYSTVGLTVGSLLAFAVGRWLGAAFVRRHVAERVWDRMEFLIRTRGAEICFLIFVLPGFPKDIACYLFGLSPISTGAFALTMTLGRMPGTWALSASGARAASGNYLDVVVIAAAVIAVGLPLYWFRDPILAWFRRMRGEA
jgi:uncharacterized membrane protein YdjX (TVP38/TMEM64 family)